MACNAFKDVCILTASFRAEENTNSLAPDMFEGNMNDKSQSGQPSGCIMPTGNQLPLIVSLSSVINDKKLKSYI